MTKFDNELWGFFFGPAVNILHKIYMARICQRSLNSSIKPKPIKLIGPFCKKVVSKYELSTCLYKKTRIK